MNPKPAACRHDPLDLVTSPVDLLVRWRRCEEKGLEGLRDRSTRPSWSWSAEIGEGKAVGLRSLGEVALRCDPLRGRAGATRTLFWVLTVEDLPLPSQVNHATRGEPEC